MVAKLSSVSIVVAASRATSVPERLIATPMPARRAMAAAVSLLSPVTTWTRMPARCTLVIAAGTCGRSGSSMAATPVRQVLFGVLAAGGDGGPGGQHPAGEDSYYEAEGAWRRAAARYSGPARTSPLVRPPRPAFPSFHLGEIYRRMMTGHLRPRNRRV
jgi:hypothetical protein